MCFVFNENSNPENETYFKANDKSLGKPDLKLYKMYYPNLQHVERDGWTNPFQVENSNPETELNRSANLVS